MTIEQIIKTMNGRSLNDLENYEIRALIHYKIENKFYVEGEEVLNYLSEKLYGDNTYLYKYLE
jgi:hypothetical protein